QEVFDELEFSESFTNQPSPIGNHENGFHHENSGNGSIETVAIKAQSKSRWKSKKANLAFAAGEAVSITRRLYRSGDSDYLLNGRNCRLRDIQDLFTGTGLSGGHYALVQQEKISQILSSKPSERRALIEEAAGITKFRSRQRIAESRLESAKTSLRRISDIVSEVEKQASSLRRQASRTKRFQVMRDEMRELSGRIFASENLQLQQQLEDVKSKLSFAFTNEQRLTTNIKTLSEIASNATQTARNAEDNLASLRETANQNALLRDRIARDFDVKTTEIRNIEERLYQLNQEIKITNTTLSTTYGDLVRLRERNRQSSATNETNTDLLREIEHDFQANQIVVKNLESESEKIRAELLQHTTASERFKEIERSNANALEKLIERRDGLTREAVRADATFREKQVEVVELKDKTTLAKSLLLDSQTRENAARIEAKTAREKLQNAQKAFEILRDEANGIKHRRETLQKLDDGNTFFAPAVQKLFAAKGKLNVVIKGTLADFLRAEARFENAIEAVFGANLQTILVESMDDVLKIAEWLKQNKIGRISLLTIKNQASETEDNAGDRIADSINVSSDLKCTLAEILPVQMQTRIVENLSDAKKFPDDFCVTLKGEVIAKQQLFALGSASSTENAKGILSFKRELRELAQRSQTLQTELSQTEIAVQTTSENLSQKEKTSANFQTQTQKIERDLMTFEMNSSSLQQDLIRAERHKKVVADETALIRIELEDVSNKKGKAGNDEKIAETARKFAETALEKTASNLATVRKQVEAASAKLSEKRANAAAENERRRSMQNALRRVETEHKEMTARLEKQNRELSDKSLILEQFQDFLIEIKGKREMLETDKNRDANEVDFAIENLKIARHKADESTLKLNELNIQISQAKDLRNNFEVKQVEIVTHLQNLHENCYHELNRKIENLQNELFDGDFDLSNAKKQLEAMREKLDNFGAVNLLAVEELTEIEARLLFLTAQRQDIVNGIESAEDALDEIKRRSRERFLRAFNEINRNFTTLFTEIFSGGSGEMKLLDASDILESGIEITAQPPGKRLQNLLLLSGGEKALTAIALVLAIFQFQPAPFCLLDEVDAPLDEANVGRFIEKVGEMSANTQFIVITHNKRTMESAKALYGVTMQEAGVSKVVSVRFD
ncbi:MAG: chromosome segregation protein SMC, partial [Pyrinomonadaceae bacterium]|nr:chromosome segregation protein SMC [Pyrinomonadaceae bacterium]